MTYRPHCQALISSSLIANQKASRKEGKIMRQLTRIFIESDVAFLLNFSLGSFVGNVILKQPQSIASEHGYDFFLIKKLNNNCFVLQAFGTEATKTLSDSL